jgi:N-acetylglucosaminyl-diphospho-decaprenol L-rhamnosyltransferase
VAAVVVNYNAASHLGPCLASIRAEGVSAVVVVDNGSTDDSSRIAASAGVRWVDTGSNLGYGAAANIGVSVAAGAAARYLLICNPDLELKGGALQHLLDRIESQPGIALVGPKVLNPDGSLYPSARTFPDLVDAIGHGMLGQIVPNNRFTRRYRLLDWDHAKWATVDWVSGACFLIRSEAWMSIGGFDPSYFMYMEDVDLCWRLHRRGWQVGYEPEAEVIHVQGVSANQHPYRMLAAHHRSLWRFASRTTKGAKRAALPIVATGLAGRFAVAAARHRFAGSTGDRVDMPLP